MKRIFIGSVLLTVLLGLSLLMSCAKSPPTAVAPEKLGALTLLDQTGGVSVFKAADGKIAVRYAKVAVPDASTKRLKLISMDEASATLQEDPPAFMVEIWCAAPAARTSAAYFMGDIPDDGAFTRVLKDRHAEMFGEDPPPPPYNCGDCKCILACCCTWGCIKCAYKVSEPI